MNGEVILIRERRQNETVLDLGNVLVDIRGRPIVFLVEPDPESRTHFYVTYLRKRRS
jgi:hypothetical protein